MLLRGVSARGVGQIAFLLAVAQKQGLQIPFLVGGPAASALQTAVGLAPQYGAGAVLYGGEPVATWRALRRIASPEKDMFLIDVQMEQMALREEYADRAKNKPFRTLSEARAHALKPDFGTVTAPCQNRTGGICRLRPETARAVDQLELFLRIGRSAGPLSRFAGRSREGSSGAAAL